MGSQSPEYFVNFMRGAGYSVAETLVDQKIIQYDCIQLIRPNNRYPRYHAILFNPLEEINMHYDAMSHRGLSGISGISGRLVQQEIKRLISLLDTCSNIPKDMRLRYRAELTGSMLFGAAKYIERSSFTALRLTDKYPGKQHHNARYARIGVANPYSRKNQRLDAWVNED